MNEDQSFPCNFMTSYKLILVFLVVLATVWAPCLGRDISITGGYRDRNDFNIIKLGKKPQSSISNNEYILSHNKGNILNVLHYLFQSLTFQKVRRAGVLRKVEEIIAGVITPFSRDI